MKKIVFISFLLILLLLLNGCHLIDKNEKQEFFSGELNKRISYQESIIDYDLLEINTDLSVADIEVSFLDSDVMKYEQEANIEELLASMTKEGSHDKLVLNFSNKKNYTTSEKTQNSRAKLFIPSGIEVIWNSKTEVGNLFLNIDNINVSEIYAESNVGNISISSSIANDSLKIIDLISNVGTIDTYLSGEYEKPIAYKAKTNIGDIKIKFPKEHEVNAQIQANEFTTKIITGEIPFLKSNGRYLLEGNKSILDMHIFVNVGKIVLDYSN